MLAVTTSPEACLSAVIAATMSIHAIIAPPNAVPWGFACSGITRYLVETALWAGVFPFKSLMIKSNPF